MKQNRNTRSILNLTDIITILLSIVGIAVAVFLFQKDMNISLKADDGEPIGVIYFKKNTAQRRLMKRNLWERLQTSSPVYDGDRIRTGNLSEAYLVFNDGTEVALYENTLIQVFGSEGNSVNFENGSISLVSGSNEAESTLTVNSGDKKLSLGQNTSALLSKPAASAEKETVLAVSSGEVYILPQNTGKKGTNNAAAFETVEAGSVTQFQSEEPKKLPVKKAPDSGKPMETATPVQKPEMKVLMPSTAYAVSQNQDEIKFVPFFWTEEKDIRLEFSYSPKFSSIIDTEYLSSDTHKGSVSLDFARNGDVIYWRAVPASEKIDPSKDYATGSITVHSDEEKQQELKAAAASVFGDTVAVQIANQVAENTKVITKNEEISMTDLQPEKKPVASKPVVQELPQYQTLDDFIQEQKEIKEEQKRQEELALAEKEAAEKEAEKISESVVTEKVKTETPVIKPAVTKPAPAKPAVTKPAVTRPSTPRPAAPTTRPAATPTATTPAASSSSDSAPAATLPSAPAISEEVKAPVEVATEITSPVITEPSPIEPVIPEISETPSTAPFEPVVTDPVAAEPVITDIPVIEEIKPVITESETEKTEPSEVVEPALETVETSPVTPVITETSGETTPSSESPSENVIPDLTTKLPQLLTPASNKVFTDVDFEDQDEPSIIFSWKEIPEAQAYKFEIVNMAGDILWSSTVRTNQYILSEHIDVIAEDGTYEWRITAITKSGGRVYSSPSSTRKFQIQFEPVQSVEKITGETLITIE